LWETLLLYTAVDYHECTDAYVLPLGPRLPGTFFSSWWLQELEGSHISQMHGSQRDPTRKELLGSSWTKASPSEALLFWTTCCIFKRVKT
jgi:hypothetical protein